MAGDRLQELATGLRANVLSKKTLLALTVGCVSGVGVAVGEVALASLVFSGSLAPYAAEGAGLVLFGTFASCLVIALRSGFLGAISAPPVPTLIVLAVIGGTIAAQGDALFATMVAVIVLCALVTGLCMLLIAHFRLANLIRFVPYPVSSGFVAGTGGVVCLVALSLMGVEFERGALAGLLEPAVAANWGLGIAYGVGLYLATKRWNSFMLLPVSFVGTAVLIHLALALFDVSTVRASELGLLFAGISEGRLWPSFGFDDLALVDWVAVAGQIPNMLTLLLVTLLCIVMYVGGLELAANRELDWNREFRAVGLAGVLGGLGGGPSGCLVVPSCLRSQILGVDMRFTGVVAALTIAAILFVGDVVLQSFPVPLMGGVLLFTGAVMVDDWLIKVRKRVPATDYAIIVVMFLTITGFGFFEGVGVGLLITIAFFMVRLSRVDLVEEQCTAVERRSRRIRPIPDRAILQLEGERARIYRLRGYMFFGSSYPLADRLKETLGADPPPKCILVDFAAVSGFDFSSVNALCRFLLAARTGPRVVLCSPPTRLADELRRNLPPPVFDGLLFARDLDGGMEKCEDILIEDHRSRNAGGSDGTLLEAIGDTLEQHLDRQVRFEEMLDGLGDWVEVEHYRPSEPLVEIGQLPTGLRFIVEGRASVYDGGRIRLTQLGPGDVVEPRAAFGASPARVTTVAEDICRTARLTPAALRLLERNDHRLAVRLYRYLLAESVQGVSGDIEES